MKVLFLSGGRRVSLAERFQQAGFDVLAYESDRHAPICKIANTTIACSWEGPWEREVRDIINKNDVDIVLPLSDDASYYLAHSGIKQKVCSLPYGAEVCRDKKKFEQFMLKHYRSVYPYRGWPKIAKPRFGCGSKGIQKIYTPLGKIGKKDYVYQKYIDGEEYSVDAYFNLDSHLIVYLIRSRDRVAGGEVVDSRIVGQYDSLKYTIQSIGRKLGLRGPVCLQLREVWNEYDNSRYIFEINSRFGGGSILSFEAGVDFIGFIKKEYIDGETQESAQFLEYDEWNGPYLPFGVYGMEMRRVNREFFFRGDE